MRENMSARKCHRGLDAQKFSSAKICTFTVYHIMRSTKNEVRGRDVPSVHFLPKTQVSSLCNIVMIWLIK